MTREQTIKVLELLNAFYAGGKNDPSQQVIAWHLILHEYDFKETMNAVLNYAKKDRREYAQFPTVGRIIEEIENAKKERAALVSHIVASIAYGRDYGDVKEAARSLISREEYEWWLDMDAEEFVYANPQLSKLLKEKQTEFEQALLEGVKE